MAGPSRQRAQTTYRNAAAHYDSRISAPFGRYRRRAVDRLQLQPGQTVLDVACGTGANFERLRDALGPEGKLVGVDLSPEMLAVARQRIAEHGWANVELVEGALEEVTLDGPFDAALFSLTHDVLQSAPALMNVMRNLRPGARVASFGSKRAPGWRVPVNLVVGYIARRYVTTVEGFEQPWRHLARIAPDLVVEPVALGGAYIAHGSLGGG